METIERLLKQDPIVERLLKNPNWRPAAEAAIAHLVHGEDCPIGSWKKSATWAQVKMVFERIKARG